MDAAGFDQVVGSEAELRELYRMPSELVTKKVLGGLDTHALAFIGLAPFVLMGTTSPDGTADVSPRGGPPGFVVALDEQRLVIADLAGNNLLDSISNIVAGSGIGLLFVVPGVDETLRLNGHACITTDPDLLELCAVKDRRPKAAIGVTVVAQYMHCAKAFRRSELWNTESWPAEGAVASLGAIMADQISELADVEPAVIDELLEADYSKSLWVPGGTA